MFLELKNLFTFKLGKFILAINNMHLFLFSYFLFLIFFLILYKKNSNFKGYIMMLFNNIESLAEKNIGNKKWTYFLFYLFFLIASLNLLGNFSLPTLNSFPFIPVFLSLGVLLTTIILGLFSHGLKFWINLVPAGIPMVFFPLMFILELLSFFMRPISMAVRLLLNITAGHFVLHAFHLIAITFGNYQYISLPLLVAVNFVEIFMGFLQAYIFVIFSSLVLKNIYGTH
jgi:F-type H+-transporting ATPase subunit a